MNRKDLTTMTLTEKLDTDYYKTKLPFALRSRNKEVNEAYNKDVARLEAEFKRDLEAAEGLENHPKRDLLYAKAFDLGHSAGYHEVANYYSDLAELLK